MSSSRLQATFDLLELGTEFTAQRFRRENPQASEEEVAVAVNEWLSDRSQAPYGDAAGRPGSWSREH